MTMGIVVMLIVGLGLRYSQAYYWRTLDHQAASTASAQLPSLGDWAQKVTMSGMPPVPATPAAPRGNDSSISRVAIPLILTAVRPGRSAHEGTADIGVDAHSPQTYAQGAVLANGARLTQIYADSVLLEKGGQSVRLTMHERAGTTAPETRDLLTVGGAAPAAAPVTISRDLLTEYVRPAAVYDGASMTGVQVYAGENGGVFYQWGLQSGDVITAIDSVPLTDPRIAMEAMQTLAQGAALTVTVDRKGQPQTIVLDGSMILSAEKSRGAAASVSGLQ